MRTTDPAHRIFVSKTRRYRSSMDYPRGKDGQDGRCFGAGRQAARKNDGNRLADACSRLPETIWDCQRLGLEEAKVDKDHF